MNFSFFFALIISIVIFNIEAQKCYAPSGDYCCVGTIANCPKVEIVLSEPISSDGRKNGLNTNLIRFFFIFPGRAALTPKILPCLIIFSSFGSRGSVECNFIVVKDYSQ